MKLQLLIKWINNFQYPHCLQTQSIHDLKSGIAICQIVYQIILNKTNPKFLNKIIISNVNLQNSINNFTYAIQSVLKLQSVPQQVKAIRPQQLYYNDQSLIIFIEYLYNQSLLKKNQAPNFKSSRNSDLNNLPKKPPLPRSSIKSRQNQSGLKDVQYQINQLKQNNNEQQLQQFKANNNYSSSRNTYRYDKMDKSRTDRDMRQQKNTKAFQSGIIQESPIKFNIIDKVDYASKVLLCEWLDDIQLIRMFDNIQQKLPMVCKNGMIFIDLLNWLNGKQIVLNQTPKYFNQYQTVQATYKKILNYLSQFQRMNPRYLFSSSELAEGNQEIFWGLLDDIYHLHHNKISRYDRRYWKISPNKKSRKLSTDISQNNNKKQEKQLKPNKFISIPPPKIKTLTTHSSQAKFNEKQNQKNIQNIQKSIINPQQISQVKQWLKKLGFSYSLQKSQNKLCINQICKDPIRNGTLLGSIVMRLQIGKVNIIKQPTSQKHIKHNFEEININCLRRSLSISSINQPYTKQAVFSFLYKLKSLNLQKKQKQVDRSDYIQKQRQIPQLIKKWIEQMQILDVRDEFSRIANSVVKVDICRQTTKKIKQNNINKILNYLKKIGLIKYLSTTYKDIMNENNNVVWDLIEDLYALKYS